MNEPVLLSERLFRHADMSLLSLEHHVGIGNLGNGGEVEDDSQQEDEACNGQVHPLDILQGSSIVSHVLEEGVRAQDRSNDGADGIERLSEVDTDLRVAWGTADYVVRSFSQSVSS